MDDPKSGAAGVSTQQAAGTTITATQVRQDVKSVDQVIEYIEAFNRSGTTPPGGWQTAVMAPLHNLRLRLQELAPMVESFSGSPGGGGGR